jgi:two-component system cell cycle response regulator
MRMYVTRLLQARDHEVRLFADGSEALDCVRTDGGVDAMITSLELGQMSGLELCWETRVLAGRDRPIYVILMSSNSDKKRLGEALDSGADDFISKPPVPDELYARLRAAERLTTMQRELVRFASLDPLTGLYNRRVFFELAAGAIHRGGVMAAIMLDIDHFKRINDMYGHDIGDQAIVAVARETQIDGAVAGRLGGEEFAVLLEGRTLKEGRALAEAMRERIAALTFETSMGPMSLTCSFGVSERTGEESIDAMLKRADVALYAAKTGGRDRVITADPTTDASFTRPGSVLRNRAS